MQWAAAASAASAGQAETPSWLCTEAEPQTRPGAGGAGGGVGGDGGAAADGVAADGAPTASAAMPPISRSG